MFFPNNKRFAFSILDDTDDATLRNVKPVYDALREHGLRTTKTVWPLDCPEGSRIFFAAETLQNKPYLDYVHELADDGFEVAFHGATMEPSRRERTIRALDFLKEGAEPQTAVQNALALLVQKTGGTAGLIMLDRQGRIGYARTTERMPVGFIHSEGQVHMDS